MTENENNIANGTEESVSPTVTEEIAAVSETAELGCLHLLFLLEAHCSAPAFYFSPLLRHHQRAQTHAVQDRGVWATLLLRFRGG